MARKTLADLSAITSANDSDLLHIRQGSQDYKITAKNFSEAVSLFETIVSDQSGFNAVIERVAANQYKIIDSVTSLYLKKLSGGYQMSGGTSPLSGGDTWGYIETNNCKNIAFEFGTFLDFGITQGYIEANTDDCMLLNIDVQGDTASAAAIAQSYLLNANRVLFDNCRTSSRKSSASFVAFRKSTTDSHNKTCRFTNCYVYGIESTASPIVVKAFDGVENKKNCLFSISSSIYKISDERINWGDPVAVGSATAFAGVSGAAITALDSKTIAFIDTSVNQLSTWVFDGSSWSIIGSSSLIIAGVGTASISALDNETIAFYDDGNLELRTYEFDGSNWSLVGSGLAIASGSTGAVAALTSDTVAFFDTVNKELRTYEFDGSNWSLVGSGLAITAAGVGAVALCAMTETDVAFVDDINEELRIYRFDGSNWALVGAAYSLSAFAQMAVAALNQTDVVFIDDVAEEINVYRFNGSTWTKQAVELSLTSFTDIAVAVLSGTDFITIDDGSDDFQTYRLPFFPDANWDI